MVIDPFLKYTDVTGRVQQLDRMVFHPFCLYLFTFEGNITNITDLDDSGKDLIPDFSKMDN